MKLVTREDIEKWASTFNSKGDFPSLISKLVSGSTPPSTQIDFPSGSTVFVGGWDGIVKCEQANSYVPQGISLWEFGTGSNTKGKRDKDYNKRTTNALEYTQNECVYILVTPRFWKAKDKWVQEKNKEGIWKEVRVYDSSSLEQWLENSKAVARWFAKEIKDIPYDGIDLAEEFWRYWSIFENIKLTPEVVTVGREKEQEEILKFLQGIPSIKSVKAASKDEAIAFIIATAKLFGLLESERFFSKALIIHNEEDYKATSTNFNFPLTLIPTFENRLPLYSAVSNNHHVIVPLGADDDFNQNTLTLPTIDRDGQINSLVLSGIIKEDAEKYSKESGRNITILKKLLNFPHNKTKWIDEEDIREIIPALLLGRWNESFIGDIELIEKLSGLKYPDYLIKLIKWKNFEDSPLIQIGETWRLTSPLDLWTNLSSFLTIKDFQNIKECFSVAFRDGNPIIEPKDKNDFEAIYNKKRKFSNWSREGLIQSLILVGCFGKGLNISNLSNPQLWVDNIIFDLLNNATGNLWISVNHELSLISEASPTSFIKAVNSSLLIDEPEIMEMFKESKGILHPTSNHTGLLWALEGLCWLPEYLSDAGLILLKLSRLDPGGSLSNRPINSISEIFKPWHYQTLTVFEDRMEVLKYITSKEKISGWTLLIRMLPDNHGIAHPTNKMRWRIFDKNTNLIYIYEEIWKTHSFVISLLLTLFDNDENKFSQLINETVNFSVQDRNKVLDWAEINYSKVEQFEYKTWQTIRKILAHHRSYPDTDWALPEDELKRYEDLFDKLTPKDALNRYIWLFNDHWPEFPQGFIGLKGEQQQEEINEARTEAIRIILDEIGLNKALELRNSVNESWSLGDALAKIVTNENDIVSICKCLNDDKKNLRFIHSFLYRKSILEGFEWITQLLEILKAKKFSNKAISNILIPLNQSQQLWNFLLTLNEEIQAHYWRNFYPIFYNISINEKIYGVEMLVRYSRFFSAIEICSHFADLMPTEILADLLRKSVTEESSEPVQIRSYDIGIIFKTLDTRPDLDHSTLINLEWLYISLLDSYGAGRSPKSLEEELSKNPQFFLDIIKFTYTPEDKTKIKEENKGLSDQAIQNRAKQGYHLLHSWKKIPGMGLDNSVNEKELRKWINEARKLAKLADRSAVADMHIGQILAQYPENIPEWPQDKIFEIMEEINSQDLYRNYSSAMFNKRGSSSRGPFDGGNIERVHAKYFEKLSKKYKNKFPTVAEIFQQLSEGYLRNAKRIDETAERDKLEY